MKSQVVLALVLFALVVLWSLPTKANGGPDTDGDGMPDGWETANGFDPGDPTDATRDADGDLLLNVEEYEFGADPQHAASPAFIYVDDDNAGDPAQDGTAAHPYASIQAAIAAATAAAVVKVLPGTYNEAVVMADGVWLIGSGAECTTIDAQDAGEAVFLDGVTDGLVAGFTLTTSGSNYPALRSLDSTVTVRHCSATASKHGIGIGQTGSAQIVACLIADNVLNGVWESVVTDIELINCTIADNTATGVVRWGTGTVTITNSILWGNADDINGDPAAFTVSYCDIEDGDFEGTNGNISADPLFMNPGAADYRLRGDSPCIDAGTSDSAPSLALLGCRRWDEFYVPNTGGGFFGWYDIGAYELARDARRVEIVVQSPLYDGGEIDAALDRYVADLARDGYTARIHKCTETTREDLRAYLKSVYDTEGLVGAVFIEATVLGTKIPKAQVEDWCPLNDKGVADHYYMDLDGLWTDSDGDGWIDLEEDGSGWENWENGDMALEIWMGRLTTTKTQRLNDYFDRNHAWRTGAMTFEERAITFVENPYASMDAYVALAYPLIVSYGWGTTKAEYAAAVQDSYEWEYHGSHSSFSSNAWIASSTIPDVNPHVGFYYIWGCHSGDFRATTNCLAGQYVFGTTYGLGALASSCSGGLNAFPPYYEAIRDGKSTGEAWLVQVKKDTNPDGSLTFNFVDWAYAIIIFGDPTLRPQGIHGLYFDITDVFWDQDAGSVKITFPSQVDVDYVLEHADADAYADGLTWTALSNVTASSEETTVADDLSTPLAADFRFYRIKRSDAERVSRNTVGVFELDLEIGWTMQDFFISTPLIPDADHASVQDVIGTQIDRNNPNIRQRIADTGLNNRMVYDRGAGTWSADVGAAFDLAVGEGYRLFAGGGIAQTLTLRLTGYVPEQDGSVLVQKPGWTQTDRWVAYGMPRPRTLNTLGLRESVTGWNSMNTLKLRSLGLGVWTTYKWDGAKWYDVSAPGVDAGSTPIACGEAAIFTRFGTPIDQDEWAQLPWYDNPLQ